MGEHSDLVPSVTEITGASKYGQGVALTTATIRHAVTKLKAMPTGTSMFTGFLSPYYNLKFTDAIDRSWVKHTEMEIQDGIKRMKELD